MRQREGESERQRESERVRERERERERETGCWCDIVRYSVGAKLIKVIFFLSHSNSSLADLCPAVKVRLPAAKPSFFWVRNKMGNKKIKIFFLFFAFALWFTRGNL